MFTKQLTALALIVAGVLAGCAGNQLLIPPGLSGTAAPEFTAVPGQPTSAAISSTALPFETPVVNDLTGLVDRLRGAGASVEQVGATGGSVFSGQGHILRLNGAEVQAFEYPDEAAARADAAELSADGSTFRKARIDWVTPPHFYQRGRLLIVYNGNDPTIINPLEFVLGRQFAGAPLGGTPMPVVVAGAAVAGTPAPACTNKALMIADVTVPDNTNIPAGLPFLKTWRLRNTGTCPWTTGYALISSGGAVLTTTTTVAFPAAVTPGGTIDLPVELTAPVKAGTYRSNWRLRDAAGKAFGIDNSRDGNFWVQIAVNSGAIERITFAGNNTSATRQANLTPGVPRAYIVQLAAGQHLIVQAGDNTVLEVLDPNTQPLTALVQSSGKRQWDATVSAGGNYTLVLRGTGRTNITVSVTSAAAIGTPTSTAPAAGRQRVSFPVGTGSVTLSVSLAANAVQEYQLTAQAGQHMQLALGTTGTTFSVAGPDGSQLAPDVADAQGRTGSFTLPANGDYIISLKGQSNTLTIEIPPR